MARYKQKYTPQVDAAIRSGYALGLSVGFIAASLGLTRGMVIGRARVLKLVHKMIKERG